MLQIKCIIKPILKVTRKHAIIRHETTNSLVINLGQLKSTYDLGINSLIPDESTTA